MKRYLAFLGLLLAVGARPAGAGTEPTPKAIREAVARAMPLIEKGGAGHRAKRTCFACHHQAVPLLAMTTARTRGLAVHGDEVTKHLRFIADFLDTNRENYQKGTGQGGQADTAGYALWALELGGWKPDRTTAAVTEYLLQRNGDLDHWRTTSNRPPSEASAFTTTYVALRGLRSFGTAGQKERIAKRLVRARGWLEKTKAADTEDRVFRLWGLKHTGAEENIVRAAAKELLATQRPDGGWAQTADLKSDAYATGTALVALHEAAGLTTSDLAYRRGMSFLLASQLKDGSWHVRSRSRPFQTYFESGFPHGKDQFISLSASSWACAALTLALPALKAKRAETNSRPASGAELRYWLTSMALYHRFSLAEMGAALGMSSADVAAALKRFDIDASKRPGRAADSPLLVLPYPGGRHPRAGFLDGAIRPQRETKVSVFAPWPDGGYAVADVPEAVWHTTAGKRELLFLAHTHVPTIWDKRGVTLAPLEWSRNRDRTLTLERVLPNKVALAARVVPGRDGVRMELSLRNGTSETLCGLQVQMCVMLKGLTGFAGRTNDNKVFAKPFAACRDESGKRWVITGWEPCVRAWGNPPCPCLHADPQIPDCPAAHSRRVRGWLSFYEGTDIDAELRRLRKLAFLRH